MQQIQKEIDLSKVFDVVKENKKQIGVVTSLSTLVAIVYCIFATPIFTAKAIINPPKLSDAGSGISQALGGLAALAGGGGLLSQKTDLDVAVAMLNTNAIRDIVVAKFNLIQYYHAANIEVARGSLAGSVKFIPDMKSGFLEIDVDSKDPKFATNIANYYGIALGQLISDVAYGRSKQKMQFFDQQLNATKESLKVAQNKLKAFALKNGISAGTQAQVIVGLSTQLQAQLVVAQSQLQAMSLYATNNNPDYQYVQSNVDGIKKQLDAISGQTNTTDQLSIPAGLAPDLSQQYTDLMRDMLMSEEVFKIVAKQYQASKLDMLSEVAPTNVQIIDPAQIPFYKSKPKRLNLIFSGFTLGLISSFMYYIFRNRKKIIVMIKVVDS